MAATALIDDLLPARADLPHRGVVEVDPHLELGVEEEGGVVLAVVGDNTDQLVLSGGRPLVVHHTLEDIPEGEAGAHGREHRHDVLQRGALGVPHHPDGHDLRPVHQRAADLDLGTAGALRASGIA